MLFPTVDFAVFFAVVLGVSWLLPAFSTPWKCFLLAASYFFYGYWDYHFVALIVASTAVNFVAARQVARMAPSSRRRRIVVGGAIAADLGALGYFKYYGFFAASLANVLHDAHLGAPLPLLQVVLPVGISFFTFQAISYVVDVHRGVVRPAAPLDFAMYLAFFPHVVAGPIVRASEFMPQLRPTRYARRLDATRAMRLIVVGLIKKVVLANFLATTLVDPVFETPSAHSSVEVLVAIYGYAVQIFADFSGYTDIAIGCALLLGIRFPDNFDAPYTARSLRDFWRRWHMTLSRWLRDYLYIPLGGNRGSRLFTYRNLVLTMVLGGLWHGAAWTFVAWGAIHGGGLAVERWLGERRRERTPRWVPAGAFLRWFVTFHVVCLAWVFFRADSLGTAWTVLVRLVTAHGPAPLVTPAVLLAVAAGVGLQFVPRDMLTRLEGMASRLQPAVQGVGLAAGLLAVGALGPQGVAPFIYFRF